MRSLFASLLFLLLVPWLAEWFQRASAPAAPPRPSLKVTDFLKGGEGFANPKPGRIFQFPQDHGPHDEFLSEWWYFTGNLEDFGYELTLFRQATEKPVDWLIPRTSQWASKHSMMGHFAISDLRGGKFYQFEKLSRVALGLAGAGQPPRLAWVEGWLIDMPSPHQFEIRAAAEGCSLKLSMSSLKAPVLQGEAGYSRKGDRPEESSYYYSLTRLRTQGEIQVPSGSYSVRGNSWMDREWSTQPLGPEMAGWDWFALQLDDGCELMFYQLRDKQGRSSRWSAGSWVAADGKVTRLQRDDLKLEVTAHWRSPVDGAEYPAGWNIQVQNRYLEVKPRLADQEMTGAVRYWEGAVEVVGGGRGYVEMVGYD
ncbi:MAG: carotenoid 1,2-hydratase [Candidatus Eremiobacteraeota bacterium]|nr:carotenoid 1,2-hydratase [Candidatus Eremiobacteraeota bacterium]MCW5871284.1 carotenoid 1,2-hydratase [Candidatus Eremiobacteraeota bacterium]